MATGIAPFARATGTAARRQETTASVRLVVQSGSRKVTTGRQTPRPDHVRRYVHSAINVALRHGTEFEIVACRPRERTCTPTLSRQAGGRWFEPSAGHSARLPGSIWLR